MKGVPTQVWTAAPEDVLKALAVEASSGLSKPEVHRRRLKFGPNRLREKESRGWGKILVDQVKSLIVALLVVAAVVAMTFGHHVEAVAILVVIAINTAIGFFTELRAVRSMEALRRLGGSKAIVRRNGQTKEINADGLVPGDIVVVEAGDSVTADLRLVEASKLQADESALTGESIPVSKRIDSLAAEVPLAERSNLLFKGTFLTRGSGEGVVVGTGMNTELGRISALVEEAGEEGLTPLEMRLEQLGRRLVWITLAITTIVALLGIVQGKDVFLMIQTGVALAVAAIPEGLPIVATIALARGMMKMARRNVLIRRLAAVETLGATTIICTDKTGTLTENEMTVTRVAVASGEVDPRSAAEDEPEHESGLTTELRSALEAGVLCVNASLSRKPRQGEGRGTGDPMELALLEAGKTIHLDREQLLERWPEVREVAFDPEVKMMATIHQADGKYRAAVKGAPETVLEACTTLKSGEESKSMAPQDRDRWLLLNEEMAGEGLRVLALAEKSSSSADEDPYRDLTLLGLTGMEDPPRDDVRDAIEACRDAGLRLVMITGDQAVTARKIAADIGLIESDDEAVIPGSEVSPPEELGEEATRRLTEASVFARVSPKQKLDLIDLHQKNGAIVAMTGDGVNDAPALEKAEIGVAMGCRGTQVAREAADMVLSDDALSSIVAAVKHGRIIFGNIRKFVIYLFSCNASEVMVVGLASAINAPLPVLPLQILFLNMVTDVFPALALGVGPGDPDVMKRPPRDPEEPLVPNRSWWAVAGFALTISVAVLGAQALATFWLGLSTAQAVTVSFLTLGLAQLWHVFNMRDRGASLVSNDITQNRVMWGALAVCVVLLLLAAHLPVVSEVLQVEQIGVRGWLLTVAMSSLPFVVGVLGHWIAGRSQAGTPGTERTQP